MLGIVAGTGFYDWALLQDQKEQICSTPYGDAVLYTGIFVGNKKKIPVVFLPRHQKNHSIPPHLINYRANLFALYQLGVTRLVAINAVGSLLATIKPGEIVLIDDCIDFTWGRQHTFFTGGEAGVKHIDMTHCYCLDWQKQIMIAAETADVPLIQNGIYVATQGPRFETRAEVQMFARLGGTVVGMTGMPEASLACELGICYGSLSMVTNYACGIGKPLAEADIGAVMRENTKKLEQILAVLAENFTEERCCQCGQDSMFL